MTEPGTSKQVEAYIARHAQWSQPLQGLRKIMLASELTEAVKWGAPSYLLGDKIVASIAGFKNHCAIWFHQGALLKDKQGKLINAQSGKTKALRQWRFVQGDRIDAALVNSYLAEAISNQKAGKAVKPEKKHLSIPDELKQALAQDGKLDSAFKALTPGRQREYADHISSAKQEKTRHSRLEKIRPLLLAGVGLHDKYRDC